MALPKARVEELAIDAVDPATVYAGTSRGGVFKSMDGGTTWIPMNDGTGAYRSVLALAIHPLDPRILYVSSSNSSGQRSAVFKTTNGGHAWRRAGVGGGRAATEATVLDIALDPRNRKTLYAGTYGGVLKSTDGGRSWRAVNNGLGR